MSGDLTELTETVARLAESVEGIEKKLGDGVRPIAAAEEEAEEEELEDGESWASDEEKAKVREALEEFQSKLDSIDTDIDYEMDVSVVKEHASAAEEAAQEAVTAADDLVSTASDIEQRAEDLKSELESLSNAFSALLELVEPWFEEEEEEEAEEEGDEAE